MTKLFKLHPKIFKFVIVLSILIFLIAIGDLIHYSKRIYQINHQLSRYGNVSYSVEKIDYPYHYGPFTEMFIYSNQLDTFYLYDNENDCDFVILVRNQGDNTIRDNYMECYVGNRFANICQQEIYMPQECRIQSFKIYAVAPYNETNTLTLNLLRTMANEDLKQAIQDTAQSNFRIQLEISGDQIQAEHLVDEIVIYLKNIVPNVYSQLKTFSKKLISYFHIEND